MALTSYPRNLCRLALVAAAVAAPASASAQVETYTRMSFTAAQIHDANLFATPASFGPQADLITRVGPAFEAGYVSLPFEIAARYELQAERYLDHPDLDANLAHQDATVSVRYRPTPRVGLMINASYIATQTPGEFNRDSQLGVGRAPAERTATASTLTYKWSDATGITMEHMFGRDAIVGGATSAMHRSRVGVQRQTGVRNTYRADYHVSHVGFDTGAAVVSHVITGGWTHAITPRTGVEITVGPRLTDGTVRPEVSTVLRRQLSRGDVTFGYSRTELTAFGERGTIDVHRVAATGRYRPWRRVSLTATPAVTRSARDDRRVPVYTLDMESVVEATHRFSVVAWGRAGRQDGMLTGPPGIIRYQSLGLKFTVTLPRSLPGDAARASS
jgi:hypothetical protein